MAETATAGGIETTTHSSNKTLTLPHHQRHTPISIDSSSSSSNSNSSTTITPTTTTFPQFRTLPTELRLQIWEHALEAPRIVDARFSHIRDGRTPHWSDAAGRRLEHAHALFFACRESRDVAVRYPRYAVYVVEGRMPVRHRLRFALTERDVLAVPADAALNVNPLLRVWGVGDDDGGGGGGDGENGGGRGRGRAKKVRQVLVLVNVDALFDVIGSGPWYPSGWPHTKVMERAVSRETFARLCSVFGGKGGGGSDLRTVYCLEEGWTSTPRGLKSLHSLPSTAHSLWESHPISTCMVKLYDKAVDGVEEDDEKGGADGGSWEIEEG
ncbi:hypothetical protein UCREL1_10720 [Eutypa lata UCREL1]|uniref:2EXR domain-containing protein n=1 Tax=Eutypa lata (strain UCR-EL1) TaxID=1287681 RepID=M7SXQ2_EUTLA|nr:hypothetical protein UCREL1_10720 [Eutypa lata UCREL1]